MITFLTSFAEVFQVFPFEINAVENITYICGGERVPLSDQWFLNKRILILDTVWWECYDRKIYSAILRLKCNFVSSSMLMRRMSIHAKVWHKRNPEFGSRIYNVWKTRSSLMRSRVIDNLENGNGLSPVADFWWEPCSFYEIWSSFCIPQSWKILEKSSKFVVCKFLPHQFLVSHSSSRGSVTRH